MNEKKSILTVGKIPRFVRIINFMRDDYNFVFLCLSKLSFSIHNTMPYIVLYEIHNKLRCQTASLMKLQAIIFIVYDIPRVV